MEEVRQLVQEEGREARNLVAYHVTVDTPSRISRKPPRALPPARRAPPRAVRLRSASAGRDKRSELRARYWALLFGDLQRSVGEIYNTVEAHENLNECQEVILVLENYTRDFKALGEWFRLKWEYDNTPPPQRPQSLAWEIRKTDFVRPESKRAYSVKSSPSVSGKNSPSFSGHNTPSGKNSPNLTGKASPGSGKISPRISSGHSSTSPKANLEFFSSKIVASKITAKPEPKSAKEASRLSDIKEKDVKENCDSSETAEVLVKSNDDTLEKEETIKKDAIVELGKAKEIPNASPKAVVVKSPKHAKINTGNSKKKTDQDLSTQAKATISQLDTMENEFLLKQSIENVVKNENMANKEKEIENNFEPPDVKIEEIDQRVEKESSTTESPTKSEDNFADVSNESSPKFTNNKVVDASNNTYTSDENDSHSNKKENKNKISNITQSIADIKIDSNNTNDIIDGKVETEYVVVKTIDITENSKDFCQGCPTKVNIEESDADKSEQKLDTKTIEVVTTKEETKDLPVQENLKITHEKSDSKEEQKNDFKKPDSKTLDTKSNVEVKSARPAYSQAAAKPKPPAAKTETKTGLAKTTAVVRSSTVVEIRPNTGPKTQRPFLKKNQTNKCSYPFNLTTGRKSLFDGTPPTPAKTTVLNKRPIRSQMNAGDSKPIAKVDPKRCPPRPTTLKVNEKGDSKEKNNPGLEKMKECDDFSSCDTIVTQIDMSRIESSESLKTLVPDMFDDVANSIEVLNVDDKSDNDGWLTVKSRRLSRESKKQSKSHWANRFNQPSATTSLPTLNMLESPKEEKPIIDSKAKKDRAKSEQPQNKPEKVVTVSPGTPTSKPKDPSMIRQKSDVTGLRTRPARNKVWTKRAEKVKDTPKEDDTEVTINRLHSSLESLTTGLARSQESTEEAFDFDKWKVEFKTTFNFPDEEDQMPEQNEFLKDADPTDVSEIAEMTSQIEENEKKISWALDIQSEVDQRKLSQEEDLLNRQIMELQQVSDIEIDTETDDTETDAEILLDDTTPSEPLSQSSENLGVLAASLEDQYETALAGMTWAERVDTLVVLEALVARDPGRAQQLHAKLSQGIKRRGSFQDALRRLQAKQARAERQRMKLQTERTKKIQQLLARVEEVKMAKSQLIDQMRLRMERRLQKAAENRDQHLKDIVRKAHDEEEKLREIAFIKQLEAENRRHEFLDLCRSHTARLRLMRRERLDKLETKAAHEAAVGARRLALEEARQRQLVSMVQSRREREARREERRERLKQERDDAAREKAEVVKSRLVALAAAAEAETETLRCRISDKQLASQQRLESHLQAIRERATGPPPGPGVPPGPGARQPTTSESQEQEQDLREQEEAERLEQERREREKQKQIRKKARKLRQKLISSGNETAVFEENMIIDSITSSISTKMYRAIHIISNMMTPYLQNGETKTEEPNEDDKPKKRRRNKKKAEEVEDVEQNNNTEEECSKRRRRKNCREDKSKASSVCSSLSDTGRAGGRRDDKSPLDTAALERQLSELARCLDKLDKFGSEKVTVPKMIAMKALNDMFAVAAAREDSAPQFSIKSLTTGAAAAARALSCPLTATHVATTNLPVHLVTLLADTLEKDLSVEPKEMELARQLADCLSVAMDSVLCSTRIYEEKRSKTQEEGEIIGTLRNRMHTIISYFCLSGCVQKAEKAGEARESVQTFLTVCADLCHPYDADIGSELQYAKQSLRCALGTNVCGSRAEFCMLFAEGAVLAQCGHFVRAARTAHLLRAVAEMDHAIVQEAFGEGGWPLEFRAAVARLLSQHAPNDKEAPRSTALRLSNQRLDQTLAETMVLDLIVLVGFVVVNNPQLQETICEGWSVIKTLCTLPANWLVSSPHCHALLPTLIALSDLPATKTAIAAELSIDMLNEYLESPDAQKVKLIQTIKQGRTKKNGKK